MLPVITSSSEVLGAVNREQGDPGMGGLDELIGVRIAGVLGDQQVAYHILSYHAMLYYVISYHVYSMGSMH
jgi:glycerol kinase